jgi:hypothetical protein
MVGAFKWLVDVHLSQDGRTLLLNRGRSTPAPLPRKLSELIVVPSAAPKEGVAAGRKLRHYVASVCIHS